MVTIRDIARRLHVSEMTVSKVLNGGHRPTHARAAARARKIIELANELGYRPNAAAKATRTGRFGSAALIMPTESRRAVLVPEFIAALHDELSENHMQLLLNRVSDSTLTDDEALLNLVRRLSCDGLLLNYTHAVPPRLEEIIERYKWPAVWVNIRRGHNAVAPDDFAASASATARVLELGHRRVVFSVFSHGRDDLSPHHSTVDRIAGYEKEMRQAGLVPRVIRAAQGTGVPGPQRIEQARAVLLGPDRPSAVVAYGQNDTIPFIGAALSLGLWVPRDLSVISFGPTVLDVLGAPVATMIIPEAEMGRAAVRMLLRRLSDPGHQARSVLLPMTFVPGGSMAAI